ncbi:Hydroxypyruvate isomerase [Anaerohalosphaera lusitana]|uniref:Hydroxypyruvate isomerase n=1 Tax=Anaerohalosphaera lusitana TaxID=1936003 RepID=A0A1U9NGT6_9BACT|nr:TIM barrel protein [Anaerohalosphaera lusitana]AQT66977.1 Hydroxypyruvate isomerase [Anaerohalosphaera lusitana]
MDRRTFISTGVAAGAAAVTATSSSVLGAEEKQPAPGKFKLGYAPSLGVFKEHAGTDPIEQIKFMADQGFTAIFDNGLMRKPPELQKKIAAELAKHEMQMGPFVLYADFGTESMVTGKKEDRDMLVNRVKEGVEVAKRTNCKWALMVPGRYNQRTDWGYQTANVVDTMKACAEACEGSEMVIVLEPLNKLNHPGLFLTKMPQAYQICNAVDHPACKIVDDVYHQQITEGDLIRNIDKAYDQIAAFHLGDNPGRREPGTGEINFKNIFKHLYKKGYKGVLCMEHGRSKKGKEGEKALIEAYREADSFEV